MKPETEILLKQFESLNNKVTLYFPSNNPISVETIALEVTKIVGGCTVTPNNKGYWNNDLGQTVTDNITLVTVFCDDDFIAPLVHLAHIVQVDYGQDCVSLEVNGRLYFIQ